MSDINQIWVGNLGVGSEESWEGNVEAIGSVVKTISRNNGVRGWKATNSASLC